MSQSANRLYYGIVEDRNDPLKLGRCRVRVVGMHTHDLQQLPTSDLPWAIVIQPVQSGNDISAPKEGTEVALFYADYPDNQLPVVLGVIPTIPQQNAVWIDQLPGSPKVRDIVAPTGRQLPPSAEQNAKDTNEEIRENNTPTNNDNAITQNTINASDTSKSASTKLLQNSSNLPSSTATSPRAAVIDQQLGHANQNQTEKVLTIAKEVGSEKTADALNVLALAQKGCSFATDILSGKMTLTDAISSVASNISSLVGSLGSSTVDNLLSGNTSLLSSVGSFVSGLSIENVIDRVSSTIDGFDQLGNGISSFISNGFGLGDTVSNLLSTETFSKIGDVVTTGVSKLSESAVNNSEKMMTSLGVPSVIAGPVSDSIKELYANGLSEESLSNAYKKLKGPGGKKISFGSGFDASAFTNGIEKKIRDCFAVGAQPTDFIDGIIEPIEKYSQSLQNVLNKLASKTSIVTGIDTKAVADSVVQFLKAVRGIIANALNLVISGADTFLEYIKKAINKVAGVIFDIFNLGTSLISSILDMLPFTDIIVNVIATMVNSLLPSGIARVDVGIDPAAAAVVVESGNYNSTTFKKMGCMDVIKQDESARASQFCNVGSGNTPPINGKQGGPNFGGADATPKKAEAQTSTNNPSQATRSSIVLTVPSTISSENKSKAQSNLSNIAEMLASNGIVTLESQAAFIAICYVNCELVPNIKDYEYTSVQSLKAAYPRTFSNASDKVIETHLFSRSKNKQSQSDFYNYVLDSSTDGQGLGNFEIGDGYKFAPAGLIYIAGRISYQKYNIDSASSLIGNLSDCVKIAASEFLLRTKGAAAGSTGFINQVCSKFPYLDKKAVVQAYEHFYGSKTFEGYGSTEKTAGPGIAPTSYYGSAQEDLPNTGFRDPNGKYPYNRDIEKSTGSALARGDWVNSIVSLKESRRLTGVPTANGGQTWDQPHSAYHAQYPYNRVKETESGLIEEWDDTPGYERIHWYHKAGTFTEIDHNGTKVTRVVGDNYEIIDRNGFISIAGDANVTVTGNVNIYCQSNASVQVEGSVDISSGGSLNIGAAKDINISAGGNVNISSRKSFNVTANQDINQTAQTGGVFITSNDIFSAVSNSTVYITSEDKQVYIKANKNVGIQSEESDVDIKANGNALMSAYSGNIDLYSGSIASLSASSSININAGEHLRQYAGYNMTVYALGFLRTTASAIDTNSNTWWRLDTNTDITASTSGSMTLSATGYLTMGSTGYINVNSGAALTIGAKGSTNIKSIGNLAISSDAVASFTAGGTLGIQAGGIASMTAGGALGLNGSAVMLNSGVSAPATPAISPLTVVAIPALPSGIAMKASLAADTPGGVPALVWGSIPPVVGSPVMPNIPVLTSEMPGRTEPIIEDDDTADTNDATMIEKHEYSVEGYHNPIEGSSVTSVTSSDVVNTIPENMTVLSNISQYNANTRLSQHLVLNDMFDGGFNRVHVLQDQCGLTKQQIVCNLAYLANNIIEKIGNVMPGGWDGFRSKWFINSGFRSTEQNARAGGSATSQHCKGMACDIQVRSGTKQQHYELAQKILRLVNQDQMILEYNIRNTNCWIHLSVDKDKTTQRNDILTWSKWSRYKKGLILYA